MVDDREAAAEMHHQMQLFISPGGRWGAGVAPVTRGRRRAAAGSNRNARKVLGFVFFLFHRLHVGVELPVTVPVVQCTRTDLARSQVAADPLYRFFCFASVRISRGKFSSPREATG